MNEDARQPIRVYRKAFHFVVVLFGSLFFLTVVLLDLFGVTSLGWFSHVPWLGYGFLTFLILGIGWLGKILLALRDPVVEITQSEVRLTHVARPSCRTTLKRSQIVKVFAQWQHDTVPTFVIFDVNSLEAAQKNSGVWSRRKGSLAYFESSNLTMNATEIASVIQKQISMVSIDDTDT